MYSAIEVTQFLKKLKQELPDISVWVYSGFTYEEIVADDDMLAVLEFCDVLVDGEFVLEQRDMTLSYRGSRNQRVIDVKRTRQCDDVILY